MTAVIVFTVILLCIFTTLAAIVAVAALGANKLLEQRHDDLCQAVELFAQSQKKLLAIQAMQESRISKIINRMAWNELEENDDAIGPVQ